MAGIFKNKYYDIYFDITISFPKVLFDDITLELLKWKNCTKNPTLPKLVSVCNKLSIPKIMCPFGDLTFINEIGSISVDVSFQRYIEFCEIDLINNNKISKVK